MGRKECLLAKEGHCSYIHIIITANSNTQSCMKSSWHVWKGFICIIIEAFKTVLYIKTPGSFFNYAQEACILNLILLYVILRLLSLTDIAITI